MCGVSLCFWAGDEVVGCIYKYARADRLEVKPNRERLESPVHHARPVFVLVSLDLNPAHTSSVAAAIRCFTLPRLSSAGRTSSEKTGEPSGRSGAE